MCSEGVAFMFFCVGGILRASGGDIKNNVLYSSGIVMNLNKYTIINIQFLFIILISDKLVIVKS